MKTITKRSFFILFSIASAIGIALASIAFVTNVKSLLWEKSVTDIIEVTQQGSHALDTYIEKDYDTLHLFVRELQETNAADQKSIQKIINVFNKDGTSFYCSNLSSGDTYSNLPEQIPRMSKKQRNTYSAMSGSSIRDPFLDDYTGVKTIGVYERFTFRDGTQGLAQKTRPLSSITERFSLSFFNQTGFSYVVNQNGDVLIRSLHKDSNRTFQNLFDIINLQGNDEARLASFKQRLKEAKTGAVIRMRNIYSVMSLYLTGITGISSPLFPTVLLCSRQTVLSGRQSHCVCPSCCFWPRLAVSITEIGKSIRRKLKSWPSMTILPLRKIPAGRTAASGEKGAAICRTVSGYHGL